MASFISAIILALVMLLALSLDKTYHHVPAKELKRQARQGNDLAKLLYHAVAYGASLQALMLTILVLAAAGSFVLLAVSLPAWFAFLITVVLLWAGFLWLPASRLSSVSAHLAAWLTPAVSWILHYCHPLFDKLGRVIHDHYPMSLHGGLYETDDLVELLAWQKEQPDNRIPLEALTIAEHALKFGGQKVSDVYVPRTAVQTVSGKDTIGPILMNELHKNGHTRFPVVDSKPERIIGTLYLHDLVEAKHSGKVSSLMKKDVHYVHEDFPLDRVLSAFLKTKHHLFIVVNSFEEFVGIITIEDILSQILGQPVLDEFDRYDDLRAVAEARAKAERVERKEADIELSDELLSEDVVE